jgi:GNAT superfamily N-acetyltransferase
MTNDFEAYLTSLRGSWCALAEPRPGAVVVDGDGFFAARFPGHPVLDNAAVLTPSAVAGALEVYEGLSAFSLWSAEPAVAEALAAAGLERSENTVPMRCALTVTPPLEGPDVVEDVDPAVVADLNHVDPELLRDVPGLRAFATLDGDSGLALIHLGTDVNVSFVATRAERRRRGLASAVMRRALASARAAGVRTASLQATPMATHLYAGLGFAAVGRWQEWVPAASSAD